MEWKMASVAKRAATSARPAVAEWIAASVAPTRAAKAGRASPWRRRSFHTGSGRYCMANTPAPSSAARIRGAAPGAASPAASSQSRSYRLRSTGASQTCATRRRGNARFTHTSPTFQISEDTPPLSASTGPVSSPAPRSRRTTGSGREAFNGPAVAFTPVDQPIVQPIGAALPELYFLRHDAIAAPVRRTGRGFPVAALRVRHRGFQHLAGIDFFALGRRPCGEARAQGARRVVGVGLRGSDFFHNAVDAHLPLEVRPEEQQAGARAPVELSTFAAEVVGIKDESALLDALQQHDARRRSTRGGHGGEGHRVGQRQLGAQRIFEPALELTQRIGVGLHFRQPGAHVFLAQIRDVHSEILPSGPWPKADFRGKRGRSPSENR